MAARNPKSVEKAAKLRAKRKSSTVKGITSKPRLSEAHARVVTEYFKIGCVSQRRALLASGYAATTASHMVHTVFGREDVQEEIQRRRDRLDRKTEVTEQRIIDELAKLAFASVGDLLEVNEDGSAYMDFNKLTVDQKAALSEYQVETYEERHSTENAEGESASSYVPVKKSRVKFASKQAALDSLARIKGMFKDKVEISGVMDMQERIAKARERLQPGYS